MSLKKESAQLVWDVQVVTNLQRMSNSLWSVGGEKGGLSYGQSHFTAVPGPEVPMGHPHSCSAPCGGEVWGAICMLPGFYGVFIGVYSLLGEALQGFLPSCGGSCLHC